MPDSAENKPRRYAAFLSYRHADNREEGRRWAEWLHQALETYEVPRDLAGKPNVRGVPVPASLYPVFRDEEELPADADLSQNIRRALENSELLIVLCSPRACQSRFVAEEIRYFKELGKSDRILALILDGEPNADDPAKAAQDITPDMECFPEPLRFGVPGNGGQIDWTQHTEPIAADARPQGLPGQGNTSAAGYRAVLERAHQHSATELRRLEKAFAVQLDLARLKLVAGALGVPLGRLRERDAIYRAQKFRRLATILGSLALFAIAAAAVAVWQRGQAVASQVVAETQRSEAQKQQHLAEQNEKQAKLERDISRRARASADEFVKFLQGEILPKLDASQQITFAPAVNERIQRYLDETQLDPTDPVGIAERISFYINRSEEAKSNDKRQGAIDLLQEAERIAAPFLDKGDKFAPLISLHAEVLRREAALFAEGRQFDGALILLGNAEIEMTRLVSHFPKVVTYVWRLELVRLTKARVLRTMDNKTQEAITCFKQAIDTILPYAKGTNLADSIVDLGSAYEELLDLLVEKKLGGEEIVLNEWATAMEAQQPNKAHLDEWYITCIAYSNAIIAFYERKEDSQPALAEWKKLIALLKERHTAEPDRKIAENLFFAYLKASKLAGEKLKQPAKEESLLHSMVADILEVTQNEARPEIFRFVAFAHDQLGDFYRTEAKQPMKAEAEFRAALLALERAAKGREGIAESYRELGLAHQHLGLTLRTLKRYREADAEFQQEIQYVTQALRKNEDNIQYVNDLMVGCLHRAETLFALWQEDGKQEDYRRAKGFIQTALEVGSSISEENKKKEGINDNEDKLKRLDRMLQEDRK